MAKSGLKRGYAPKAAAGRNAKITPRKVTSLRVNPTHVGTDPHLIRAPLVVASELHARGDGPVSGYGRGRLVSADAEYGLHKKHTPDDRSLGHPTGLGGTAHLHGQPFPLGGADSPENAGGCGKWAWPSPAIPYTE